LKLTFAVPRGEYISIGRKGEGEGRITGPLDDSGNISGGCIPDMDSSCCAMRGNSAIVAYCHRTAEAVVELMQIVSRIDAK
jgi:hypothetical protein